MFRWMLTRLLRPFGGAGADTIPNRGTIVGGRGPCVTIKGNHPCVTVRGKPPRVVI